MTSSTAEALSSSDAEERCAAALEAFEAPAGLVESQFLDRSGPDLVPDPDEVAALMVAASAVELSCEQTDIVRFSTLSMPSDVVAALSDGVLAADEGSKLIVLRLDASRAVKHYRSDGDWFFRAG